MALIWRIVVILFAILCATLAAGLIVVGAVMFPEASSLDLGPIDRGGFALMAGFTFVFISGFSLLPAAIIALVTEAFSIRSLLVYALGGGVVGFMAYLAFVPFDTETMRFTGLVRREVEVMIGAGVASGLVYWLIAGRNAGSWRAAPAA